MDRSKLVTLAAVVFAGLGVAWALRAGGCRLSAPAPPPTGTTDTAAVAHLGAISEFLEPTDEAERASIVTGVAASLRARLTESDGRLDARDDLLLRMVRERIELMLDPDYDRYLAQVTAWTGRDGAEAVKGTMFEDRALWEAFAAAARSAAIGPEGVLVRGGAESLADPESLAGGARATLGDPGYYGAAPLLARGAEVRDVVIPMIVYTAEEPKGFVAYATIGFVWDQNRRTWVPYETGLQDPTGQRATPPLWI